MTNDLEHWSLTGPQPIEMRMVLVDEEGGPYELLWRPPLPSKRMFLRSVSVHDVNGVPIVTVPFLHPDDDQGDGVPQ